jgi:hypothetical protein
MPLKKAKCNSGFISNSSILPLSNFGAGKQLSIQQSLVECSHKPQKQQVETFIHHKRNQWCRRA